MCTDLTYSSTDVENGTEGNPSCPVSEMQGLRELPRGPHPELWEKNVRKRLRVSGMPYTDVKGQMHCERTLKPNPCIGKRCQNKCADEWSEEARLQLFKSYWSLGHQRQRDFIANHVRTVEVKRRRVIGKQCRTRTKTLKYTLPDDSGKAVSVCKQFFLQTLDIRHCLVQYTVYNAEDGFAKADRRGKHRAQNKTPQAIAESVRTFIKSLPAVPSHYCRAGSSRLYLPASMQNLKRVYLAYKLYMRRQAADVTSTNLPVASQNVFEQIFREEFNIGFHCPKKDHSLHGSAELL